MTKPRIKVISDGSGSGTKVLTENGIDISRAVTDIEISIKATEHNTAKLKTLLVGAEIDAEIIELQTKVLPPPPPKTKYRFTTKAVGPNTLVLLEKLHSLAMYGAVDEVIFRAQVPYVIEPLELVFEEAE